MSTIVTIASSPNVRSRSTALLSYAETLLQEAGFNLQRFDLGDFPAEDLLGAHRDSEAAISFNQALAAADGVVIAGPVYKSTYNAVLKGILDLVAKKGLAGKAVVTLTTVGNPDHRLLLERHLRPLLAIADARIVVEGAFAADDELPWPDEADQLVLGETVQARVQAAVRRLRQELESAT